ncbi:2OG-Fe(II) oxygenase [Paraburkholderia megapolitana]|uniref:2OG-Fe(II) oxygenase n=1 Tax=Paraburkholderia megapolitana TaxID=420953 RepID=UPI0038B739F9
MPSHFMLQDTLPGVEPRDLIESKSSEVSNAHSDDATLDRPSIASTASISHRVDTADWPRIARELDQYGCAMLPGLLDARECNALAALYPRDDLYRSRVVMARHGFGRGEYRYFDYPLPDVVGGLRTALYPHLVPMANRWNETMGIEVRYPTTHAAFLRRCHDAGQLRPTPLILQYGKDDYNCLHQDLYGEHVFPLQAAILLSEPDVDFSGGEFVMTEQRPRMQSRVEVVPLRQGDAAIFAVHHRPVQGTRGPYRVNLRHGVSRLRSGRRHTLGVIFHDAL